MSGELLFELNIWLIFAIAIALFLLANEIGFRLGWQRSVEKGQSGNP